MQQTQIQRKYNYKYHELLDLDFPPINADPVVRFSVNSLVPIDKVRLTIIGNISMDEFNPGLLVYCSMVNNYIGTIAMEYTVFNNNITYYSDLLQPENGVEFFYPNKVQLMGEYELRFSDLITGIPLGVNPLGEDQVFLLVEYFAE
jgi:hypothetical protein